MQGEQHENEEPATDQMRLDAEYDPRALRARRDIEDIRESDGIVLVKSVSGNLYHVDLDAETCDCPDYEHRGVRCKHIRAAEKTGDGR